MRVLALVLLAGCAVPDGVYLVRDAGTVTVSRAGGGKVAIGPKPDVPFDLAEPPVLVEPKEGQNYVDVTLTPECGALVEKFTSEHQGGSAAFVVDGVAVSVHKIRGVIRGSKLRIYF